MQSLFHLAIHVRHLDEVRHFYGAALGCAEGQPGEQWTMFFCDPSGNPLEIKGLQSFETVHAT